MKELIQFLIDEKRLSMSRRGGIKIDGFALGAHYHKKVVEVIGYELLQKYGVLADLLGSPIKTISEMERIARTMLYEANKLEFNEEENLPESSIDISRLRFVLDMTTDKEHLFNVDIRQISKITPSALRKILDPETKNQFFSRATPSIFSFDPYDIAAVKPIQFEGMSLTQFNLYQPPPWMASDSAGNHAVSAGDVVLPGIVHEFMEHVFPKKRDRDFVWHWMHEALVGRAETYLVLNGKKGLGKGVLSEKLLPILVGQDNFRLAPESLLTSDFNAALDRGRLIVLDEVRIDSDLKLNKLKRYINARQTIERKGVDADKVITTYNSFVISNNDILDMRLYWDDRRFSVPDLNNKTLRDAWGQKKIDEFIRMIDNEQFQRDFGYYVFYHAANERQDEFSVLKGDHFYRIVYHSLAEWERLLVDTLLSKESAEYDLRDIRSAYKARTENGKFPVKPQRIRDFLESYRHLGEFELGAVEEKEDGIYIVPSERYMPKESIFTSDQDYV